MKSRPRDVIVEARADKVMDHDAFTDLCPFCMLRRQRVFTSRWHWFSNPLLRTAVYVLAWLGMAIVLITLVKTP